MLPLSQGLEKTAALIFGRRCFFLVVFVLSERKPPLECRSQYYRPPMASRYEHSPVNFKATPDFVEQLNSAAKSLRVQKSALMRGLIIEGIERLQANGLVPAGVKS